MTRHPYGPDELDRHDPALDETARRLEEYASASGGEPPLGLAARVRMAIDAEPPVVVGWWAAFLGWRHGVPARMAAVAGVVVLAVAGALALGEIARNARIDNVGTSPQPSAVPLPSSTATQEPTPSLSPSPSDLPSPTVAPTPTERETVEPSHDDDGVVTPTPSESDHSGPGGGGGGGSGSGSGSGSSGSGSSGSGSDD
jgi:uncharacterized membrane protein YgcG